jgi:hypothetical protein
VYFLSVQWHRLQPPYYVGNLVDSLT